MRIKKIEAIGGGRRAKFVGGRAGRPIPGEYKMNPPRKFHPDLQACELEDRLLPVMTNRADDTCRNVDPVPELDSCNTCSLDRLILAILKGWVLPCFRHRRSSDTCVPLSETDESSRIATGSRARDAPRAHRAWTARGSPVAQLHRHQPGLLGRHDQRPYASERSRRGGRVLIPRTMRQRMPSSTATGG